jgi:uncharacterized protein YdbL (DUF1318 family)
MSSTRTGLQCVVAVVVVHRVDAAREQADKRLAMSGAVGEQIDKHLAVFGTRTWLQHVVHDVHSAATAAAGELSGKHHATFGARARARLQAGRVAIVVVHRDDSFGELEAEKVRSTTSTGPGWRLNSLMLAYAPPDPGSW